MKDRMNRRTFFGRAAAAFLWAAAGLAGAGRVTENSRDEKEEKVDIERTSRVPADYSRELAG